MRAYRGMISIYQNNLIVQTVYPRNVPCYNIADYAALAGRNRNAV